EQRAEGQTEPRAPPVARAHERSRVGADAEECGVTERDLTGIAAGDVPRGGEGAPEQDQDHAVENERVAHEHRRRRGGTEEHHSRPAVGCPAAHAPSVSAPRWPKMPAGRKTRTPMNKRK